MKNTPLKVFVIYAHEDKSVRDKLLRQLHPLSANGEIILWSDHKIMPGEVWEDAIRTRLVESELILLLVSDDFFVSDYIQTVELRTALERHARGETRLLPIITRHCGWEDVDALARLQVLPPEGRPVISKGWESPDEPYYEIYQGVRTIVRELRGAVAVPIATPPIATPKPQPPAPIATPPITDNMVFIPGGTFMMGDTNEQLDSEDHEKPAHRVTLDDFYLSRYAVTVAEYLQFCTDTNANYPEWMEKGNKRNINTGTDNHYKTLGDALTNPAHPIVGISWHDAVAYCQWYAQKTGKPYRLPTEAEWEYAARGGNNAILFGNGKNIAHPNEINFNASEQYKKSYSVDGEYRGKTVAVGSLQCPNALGLHDMSGNVWEWCNDWYGEGYYKKSPPSNPTGPTSGSSRVLRGGSWFNSPHYCRTAYRNYVAPGFRNYVVGFRLARTK